MTQKIRYQIMLESSTVELLNSLMGEEPLVRNYSQAINLMSDRYNNLQKVVKKLTEHGTKLYEQLENKDYELRMKKKEVKE